MNAITTKQFLMASSAYTVGCILWAFPPGSAARDWGTVMLFFGGFFTWRRSDFSRPLSVTDGLVIFLFGPVLALLASLIERVSPGLLTACIHHPVSITLLWALTVIVLYRRWKRTGSPMGGTVA